MNKVGLFPLGLVLYPKSSYPLYIYEERYKALINECWNEQKLLGITLLSPSKMSEVGCLTYVSDIMKVQDSGEMEILVTGKNRFRIKQILDGNKPYLEAIIEKFEDTDSSINPNLLGNVLDIYNEIARKVKKFKIQEIDFDSISTNQPSFSFALKSGLSLEERQKLLEMQSENQRLEMLYSHLKFLQPIVEKAEGIERIARNDGYFSI
jgi:Lon protease-like protein